jgi:multidrug efflux pump subunit AcrB
MWIVRLALQRPRMIAVMAILIFILGGLNILQMPKDIFPQINVPVVAIIWSYQGLAPEEVDRRVLRVSEQFISATVSDIEHIESQALSGNGIIKVYFQPGTEISEAITQIETTSQSAMRTMPPGITPPEILQYDAADVPVVQLILDSDTEPVTKLSDLGTNVVLAQLITVKGVASSPTNGGADKLINVDLDPQAMTAKGVSALDVTTAIGNQNLILPAGDAKMGVRDYYVRLNNSPTAVDQFNDLPIKVVNGATVYVRDIAHVRDGSAVQVSMVRVNNKPAVLLTILKNGGASTLDVVAGVKAKLPAIRALLPEDVKLDLLLDQSTFVSAAVTGVVREAVIAACLTGLMILLFLGSWRSTLVVAISIPLSILASIIVMGALGQTLNTLTLGGLSLAVGMLVDDATVEVENTTRNLGEGYPLRRAILHSAQQVALPALTSTLSICIVFVPVAFLSGVATSLFVPLAMAVVFAMIPSYLLSRTLVTTMMQALLGKELDLYEPGGAHDSPSKRNIVWHIHEWFEVRFESLRDVYHRLLEWVMYHRVLAGGALMVFFAGSLCLMPFIGQDFFPDVDAGELRLHVRCPTGTRLEETGKRFSQIENSIRQLIPAGEVTLILDNIGLASGESYVRGNSGTISSADGEIDISLSAHHHPSAEYQTKLRLALQKEYPDCVFYFQPADMETQVLDFGTSAPIDIQIMGAFQNQDKDYQLAKQIEKQVARVPGVVDSYIYQIQEAPELQLNVDRSRAIQMGLTQSDVANSILIALSSSTLLAPSYYLDPTTGFQYIVSAQTPQYKLSNVDQLMSTPISLTTTGSTSSVATSSGAANGNAQQPAQLLSNLATISRDTTPAVLSEYQILPVFDVFASVENRDLGGVTSDIQKIIAKASKKLPRGTRVVLNGQALTMQTSFLQLGLGLIFAIVLIYLLLTVNFESWVDPMVILMAAPGALSGVLWGLFVTRTTFNVPSLMGTIMSIGVATANSILLVTFANEQRHEGKEAVAAALAAGFTRFRPVVMTALAMILGMLPMSLGMGEGGEQNAPLGRAVIGGLSVATITTLFFVPIMYSVFRRKYVEPLGEFDEGDDKPMLPTEPSHSSGSTGATAPSASSESTGESTRPAAPGA